MEGAGGGVKVTPCLTLRGHPSCCAPVGSAEGLAVAASRPHALLPSPHGLVLRPPFQRAPPVTAPPCGHRPVGRWPETGSPDATRPCESLPCTCPFITAPLSFQTCPAPHPWCSEMGPLLAVLSPSPGCTTPCPPGPTLKPALCSDRGAVGCPHGGNLCDAPCGGRWSITGQSTSPRRHTR